MFSPSIRSVHPEASAPHKPYSGSSLTIGSTMDQPKQKPGFDIKIWGWSILSIIPWAINASDKVGMSRTTDKGLQRGAQSRTIREYGSGRANSVRFRPYVSKVPWHTGPRAFLSMLFPRYGHYCGPNWSSGKNGGSLLWDKRPIDWLDYCCYCHDMGYDSHDQAKLLEADLAFLDCLEKPQMATKGDANVAHVYKTMCITGLRNILIPYRMQLVKLQPGQSLINFGWLGNMKWSSMKGFKPPESSKQH